MKKCTMCGRSKELTEFSPDKRKKDGRQARCKKCMALVKVQAYKEDPEVYRGRSRTNRKEHPEKIVEWNRKNKGYQATWWRNHPELRRAKDQRRRARKKSADGDFTPEDIARIYTSQEGRCAYCNIELNGVYHIDHIYPLSRGGSNWPSNLACACPKCNLSKSDKTLEEWLT